MPVMKFALGQMDEYLFNALRLTLSALVLAICAFWQRAPIIDRAPSAKPIFQQIVVIVIFSVLTGFAYQVLFLLGIDSTSSSNTALIMSTIPMWAAVLALILLKEKLSSSAWIGLTIALVGTIVVSLSQAQVGTSQNTIAGNLLVSAAAFSWALGTVVSRPIMKNVSPIALAFIGVTLAVPLHFVIARHALGEIPELLHKPKVLFALAYSGVFSTGLAYAMWNYGVKHLGAAHAAVFQNLVPLVAILTGWLLIGEVPIAVQVIGGVLIIGGLVIMRRRKKAITNN